MFSNRIGFQQLFGWHGYQANVKKNDKVVITSSEFDAMAITQETDMLGLSVPKGTELPLEVNYEYKDIQCIHVLIVLLMLYCGNCLPVFA